MCQEIIKIVQSMDLKSAETQLAIQCAPFITGIRISNLLMIDSECESAVRIILKHTGISYFKLLQTKDKTAFLLFRRCQLEEYLYRPESVDILKKMGYEDLSFGTILRTFQERYKAHINLGGQFPHEMGLLLGYPIEDVNGFILNDGENYLYSGYWKVYKEVEEKKVLFEQFEASKEHLIQLLADNMDLRVIIERYNDIRPQKMAV